MTRNPLIYLAPLLVAGCVPDAGGTAGGGGPHTGWMQLTYACSGGQNLQAAFSPAGERASIKLDGQSIDMVRAMSSTGASYRAASGHVLDAGHRSTTLIGPGGAALRSGCLLG